MDIRVVLLLGNGGRENAWALAIKQSNVQLINWAKQINPGIRQIADQIIEQEISTDVDLSKYNKIDLAIIGPEAPLVEGISDWLSEQGITVFGPSKANARLEGSKIYMRELMSKYEIMGNIEFSVCRSEEDIEMALDNNYEVAVKPDGLTGGKGVHVYGDHFKDKGEVFRYAKQVLETDGVVLLEELLEGIEFTLQGFVNGDKIVWLPLVKDYKRAFEGDIGPNTGSMGSCSFSDHRLPYVTDHELEEAKSIVGHVARAAGIDNGAYVGAIYGQFMLTIDGPKIVEFNVRLGDPEAINTLLLLETPLLDIIKDLLSEKPKLTEIKYQNKATVCVYLVPDGYPTEPEGGSIIDSELKSTNCKIIYASVIKTEEGLVTTNSRSLAYVGFGNTIEEARKKVYQELPKEIEGLRYRNDIGEEFIGK